MSDTDDKRPSSADDPDEVGKIVLKSGNLDMTETDLAKVRHCRQFLSDFYKTIMQEGTDYGIIPGTPKPSLWKSGAEILARGLNLSEDTQFVAVTYRMEITAGFRFQSPRIREERDVNSF